MALEGSHPDMRSATPDGPYVLSLSAVQTLRDILSAAQNDTVDIPENPPHSPPHDALLILLPLLIVLSTFLFMLLFFLVCVILIRRRRGIVLRDNDGPVDMSREDLIDGEGGFEGVESRWMESVSEPARREYLRAKGACLQRLTEWQVHIFSRRFPASVSAELSAHRHHTFAVPLDPRKGRLRVVFRTRL